MAPAANICSAGINAEPPDRLARFKLASAFRAVLSRPGSVTDTAGALGSVVISRNAFKCPDDLGGFVPNGLDSFAVVHRPAPWKISLRALTSSTAAPVSL